MWIAGNYKPEKPPKEAILKEKEESRKPSGSFDLEEFLVKEKKGQKHAKTFKKAKARMFEYPHEDQMQEYWETYKSEKERQKKQKNHLHNYVQSLKDVREESKNINEKEKSLKHRWLDFTHAFSLQAFGKTY